MNEFVKFEVGSSVKANINKIPLLDPGVYNAMIFYVGWNENKKKTGKYLRINFSVLLEKEGRSEVKTFSHFFNLNNPSKKTVEKAQMQFSAFLRALEIDHLDFNYEIGIAPYEYKRIYGKFIKVDVSTTEDQEGNIYNTVKEFISSSIINNDTPINMEQKTIIKDQKINTIPLKIDTDPLDDDIPF